MNAGLMARRPARTAAGLAMLATAFVGLVPAGASGTVRRAPCDYVTASPSFPTDHVLFCAAATHDGSGVDFYRSSDQGGSWAGPYAVERFPGSNDDFPLGIWPSPAYDTDHTLYVGGYIGGTAVSTDGGTTFAAVLNSASPSLYDTTAFLDGAPSTTVARPELIVPHDGAIYDPLVPMRPLPPDATASLHAYIVPPDYPSTHQAVALGAEESPTGVQGHAQVYGCTAEFVCSTVLQDFAPFRKGDDYTGFGWSGPTYPSGHDYYAVVGSGRLSDPMPVNRVYRSTDFGRSWTVWTSVTKLFAAFGDGEEIFINASPDAPHRLFLHLTGGANPATVPDEQLYRSDDNGMTWHRIGYAWGPKQKARSRSTLPWNTAPFAYGATVVEPGGRLYIVGEHDTGKRTDYSGLYCSRDYGTHWSTNC